MTDNEIIKALECLCGGGDSCTECAYHKKYRFDECRKQVAKDTLGLVKRQQAEIERLQKEVNLVSIQFQDLQERYEEAQTEIERLEKESEDKERAYNDEFCIRKEWQTKCQELLKEEQIIKSEAVKEFAERLKKIIRLDDDCQYDCVNCYYECGDYVIDIDNLVKEMIGDTK